MQKKELFIVEGKSAASSLVQAIDTKTQTVHAIQGKLVNVDKVSSGIVSANLECQKLISILGCGVSPHCMPEKLNCSSVLILMDPDIDGRHSSALLLSFFARYCEPIVASGLLSIIKPPMFRVRADGCNSTYDATYAWSEEELQQILEAEDATNGKQNATTTRFKGVAQFSVQECHQLLLQPKTRRQFKFTS